MSMTQKRLDRIKHIRAKLGTGLQTAQEVERGEYVIGLIKHGRTYNSTTALADAMHEMALDLYGVRNFKWENVK